MSLDLSQNEFESVMALALEGNGLSQGLCKPAARVALLMALDDRNPVAQALAWSDPDVIPLIRMLAQAPPIARRVTTIDVQSWKQLKTLAYRTYVPESEASKLAGAGAGTQDND